MKKLLNLFFVLMIILGFIACDDSSDPAPVTDTDYDYSKSNPPAYATIDSADYHCTLPDQYNFLTNYPSNTIDDERSILFPAYTETDGIVNSDSSTGTCSGYALDQFVNEADVHAVAITPLDGEGKFTGADARKMFSVVSVSNKDGFSNRSKFISSKGLYNADLRWDQFIQGYLLDLYYDGKIFFPESVGLAKMYNNQYAYDIYLIRKIDVKRPDSTGTIATFEVNATTGSYVDDTNYTTVSGLATTKFTVSTLTIGTSYTNVNAISLDQFITEYITDSPSSYKYNIIAVDDFSRDGWTYENMKQAYYLPDYEVICQVDSSTGYIVSGTKINFPVRIDVVE